MLPYTNDPIEAMFNLVYFGHVFVNQDGDVIDPFRIKVERNN